MGGKKKPMQRIPEVRWRTATRAFLLRACASSVLQLVVVVQVVVLMHLDGRRKERLSMNRINRLDSASCLILIHFWLTMTTTRAERRRFFGGAGVAPLAAILLAIGNTDAFSSQGGLLIGRVPRLPARDVSVHSSRRRRVPRSSSSFRLKAEPGENANDNDNTEDAEACPDNLDVATPLPLSSWKRLVKALPAVQRKRQDDGTNHSFKVQLGDDLDRQILGTALPSMLNLAVVPVVNTVDVFWVGKLGSALALAGQAAANQAFFTLYCE